MNENNVKALESWNSAWAPETHTTEYAIKRIKSAKSSKLTPVKIDTNDMYGYFQGNHGRYETFLDYCPCGDFLRSKLPCKHIYRLAIELGLLNITADSNVNSIPTPRNEQISLDDTIDLIETLSEGAQRTLLSIATCIDSTTPTYLTKINESILELLKSEIIADSTPENHLVDFRRKIDTCVFLDSLKIPYKKNATKAVLEELCLKCAPKQAAKEFGQLTYVTIPSKFRKQKIHYYLHRKYDSDNYFDEDMSLHHVPLLETDLPDDDVTNQLIKHGYYLRD